MPPSDVENARAALRSSSYILKGKEPYVDIDDIAKSVFEALHKLKSPAPEAKFIESSIQRLETAESQELNDLAMQYRNDITIADELEEQLAALSQELDTVASELPADKRWRDWVDMMDSKATQLEQYSERSLNSLFDQMQANKAKATDYEHELERKRGQLAGNVATMLHMFDEQLRHIEAL